MLKSGNPCYYPIKYYCFNSVIAELERLIQRENFTTQCEEWRKREMSDNEFSDIYDGNLWKQFQTVRGKDFLKSPRNYGLMLNFDFFQPMKHRKDYSIGVFYLVILNLPRKDRFKWENVIVVGIVPSLDREPKNLNEFLQPTVNELKALWTGVKMKYPGCRLPITFRAALMSTSSDVPATRKLCGFKSHSAILGCSRCLKSFPGEFGKSRDYSGFDRSLWKPRTNKEHREHANKLKRCKTKKKLQLLGKKYGITHYSALLGLEYFDIIKFSTIDPMHNLFLGTTKKMFTLWNDRKLFSPSQLRQIEERIDAMEVPSDIGRLPKRITTNAGSYTAEQWKNWTLIYSLYCLHGILSTDHYKCWHTYVLACEHICKHKINKSDIDIADFLLLKFCKEVERLYGKEVITPNMHLHCHLKEVILDHGPISSFWCFGFEHFNSILVSTTTNKRSVEIQVMRRLTISRSLDNSNLPVCFRDEFLGHCFESETSEPTPSPEWQALHSAQTLPTVYPITQ